MAPTAPVRQAPAATDESWPDEPLPEDHGSPPSPNPGLATNPGLAAARSAAKAAAQAGPRVVNNKAAGNKTADNKGGWPDAVPSRKGALEADEVDRLHDAGADVNGLTGMALIQRELGGQVIGEIDHN
jgi:DNA polymerase III subunit gamma/tau